MINEHPDTDGHYKINIVQCMSDLSYPDVVRRVFRTLHENTYINVGEFFGSLTEGELDILSAAVEDVSGEPGNDQSLLSLTLLGVGLLVGEGRELTDASVEEALRATISMCVMELLYRRGLIEVHREHWTTDTESDLPVASAIPPKHDGEQ